MRLWADGSGVNNPHEFDALLGQPSVHVRINDTQEAELDEIRVASRALDFAGNLRVSDTTQYFPNSAPTPLPDDLYSGRFDPDPSHLWTLLPYFDSPAPVQQRDTEQPQLSIEVQASDTNIGQTSSFVCDLCQIVCFDSTSLRCVIPRRTWVQCQRLTRSRRHKGKHTDKARRYPCEVGDCDHGFRYKKDLLKHHASKHDRSLLVTHFCEEKEDGKDCDKKYTRRDRLLRHWR